MTEFTSYADGGGFQGELCIRLAQPEGNTADRRAEGETGINMRALDAVNDDALQDDYSSFEKPETHAAIARQRAHPENDSSRTKQVVTTQNMITADETCEVTREVFKQEIMLFYPDIPDEFLKEILDYSLKDVLGRRGYDRSLPPEARTNVAVAAYLRHSFANCKPPGSSGTVSTPYKSRNEIRKEVRNIMRKWKGSARRPLMTSRLSQRCAVQALMATYEQQTGSGAETPEQESREPRVQGVSNLAARAGVITSINPADEKNKAQESRASRRRRKKWTWKQRRAAQLWENREKLKASIQHWERSGFDIELLLQQAGLGEQDCAEED